MALDFPNTPTNGQSFTDTGTTWIWDGTKWTANSTVAAMSSIYLPLTGGTLTGALTLPAGAQGTPSLNFTGDLTSGLYRKSAGYLGLSIVGSDVMTWNNTGKTTTSLGVIAINTTPPSTTLIGTVVAERLVLPADGVYFNGYTTGGGNWLRYATGHSAWIGGSPGSAISLQLTTASGAAGSSAISSIIQWVFDGVARTLTLPGQLLIPLSNAGIELGHLTIVNTPFIDFHSSGNNNDYDVRLVASGGTATNGSGTLTLTCGLVTSGGSNAVFNAVFAPAGLFVGANNVTNFGMFNSGIQAITRYLPGWYWAFDTTIGHLIWYNNAGLASNQGWIMRGNDGYNYGNIGPTGGNGAYFLSSDERRKRDIVPAECGLDEIMRIEPIRFKRIGTSTPDREEIGFSAQQLQTVLPDAVFELEPDLLAMQDLPIVAALVNAVKTLTQRVHALEGRHV